MVKTLSDRLGMNLGLEKYTIINTARRKISEIQNIKLIDKTTTINALSEKNSSKYLGTQQALNIRNKEIKYHGYKYMDITSYYVLNHQLVKH